MFDSDREYVKKKKKSMSMYQAGIKQYLPTASS